MVVTACARCAASEILIVLPECIKYWAMLLRRKWVTSRHPDQSRAWFLHTRKHEVTETFYWPHLPDTSKSVAEVSVRDQLVMKNSFLSIFQGRLLHGLDVALQQPEGPPQGLFWQPMEMLAKTPLSSADLARRWPSWQS